MSDLIKRADAIEAILGEPMNEARYPSWYASKIIALPSADRPKGKWINESDMDFSCSVCGQMATVAFEHEGYPMINYCPNCGAKMVDSEKPSVNQMRGNTDD